MASTVGAPAACERITAIQRGARAGASRVLGRKSPSVQDVVSVITVRSLKDCGPMPNPQGYGYVAGVREAVRVMRDETQLVPLGDVSRLGQADDAPSQITARALTMAMRRLFTLVKQVAEENASKHQEVHQILELRFHQGLTWDKVGKALGEQANTLIHRYVRWVGTLIPTIRKQASSDPLLSAFFEDLLANEEEFEKSVGRLLRLVVLGDHDFEA